MNRPRVLFVDDEPRILDGLRRSLRGRRHDWEMSFVTSGAAALEVLESTPQDVVVSDMRMPGMDGAELLTRISRRHPAVARVVLSGHTEPAAAIKVAIAGHRFLTKPTDVEHVTAVITELTARAGAAGVDVPGGAVRRAAGAVRSLPTPPEHLDRIRALVSGPEADLSRAGLATAHNVGLTAKLLQLSTSPFFTSRLRVASIDSVVNAVGVPTIQALVGTGELLWAPPAPAADLTGTVRHALATADLVATLASPGNRPYAQAAALLQDVGRFVCAAGAMAAADLGDAAEGCPGAPLRAVGVELLRLWGLPAPVVAAVALRDREHAPGDSGLGVAAAVRAAHLLVQQTDARDPDAGTHEAELARLLGHPQLAAYPARWRQAADEAAARAAEWAPAGPRPFQRKDR